MKTFKKLCEEYITEKKSWKISLNGKPIGLIVDTGMQTKYAFDGFKGAEREVQTYQHTNRKGLDDMNIKIFDNGKKKTLSYGSQDMGAVPSKLSDMEVIAKFFKLNHGPDSKVEIK